MVCWRRGKERDGGGEGGKSGGSHHHLLTGGSDSAMENVREAFRLSGGAEFGLHLNCKDPVEVDFWFFFFFFLTLTFKNNLDCFVN